MKEKHYEGLTTAQVLESRQKHGANTLSQVKKIPTWRLFLKKFQDPLISILLVAGVLSIGISCYDFFHLGRSVEIFLEPTGIFIAVLLATGIAFIFERRADKEFTILNLVNDDEPVEVIREGRNTIIMKKEVVVDDIVIINPGQEIPADGELLNSISLNVDESSLTGESICRKSHKKEEYDSRSTFPTNHVLRGTKVMEGHGVFRVIAVGDQTENGKVYKATQIDNSIRTPLNKQLDGLAKLITKISYILAAFVIVGKLMNYFNWAPISLILVAPTICFFWLAFYKFPKWKVSIIISSIIGFFILLICLVVLIKNISMPNEELSALVSYTLDTLMIAVTLIVVAVPEGLPMAVTLSLAYSMRRMLKTKNLVRKMHACETMGAATVICTDKTGTLTQNQMCVSSCQFYNLNKDGLTNEDKENLINEGISINSTASLEQKSNYIKVIGNPTEGALLLWLKKKNVNYQTIRETAEVIEEIPFSTERKYMATYVISSLIKGVKVLYVKGAPEIVYNLCKYTANNIPKENIMIQLKGYQERGMRTLGFAFQFIKNGQDAIHNGQLIAKDLIFMGFVVINDPIRMDVPEAVYNCIKAGINLKIVTGDNSDTAKEIGRKIGLWRNEDAPERLISGDEFSKLSDEELDKRVENLKIISRARPLDKKRLVESLQRLNHVVAVTGDGTNDAPALKAAHVGLSMGDGTFVAKEASDITIIDNSFGSIVKTIMWGRSLYKNIQRFLLFQLTVNVAACLLVLFGAFMGSQSPLTVTQLLWVNLIMDTFAAMALSSLPPSKRVMNEKPRARNAFIINKDMYINILGVGAFFFSMLLVLLFLFEHTNITTLTDMLSMKIGRNDGLTAYELTLLFTIFVMTHFFYLFNAREFETGDRLPNLKGCKYLLIIAGLIFIGQIMMVEIPFLQIFFNVVSLSIKDWCIIIVCSSLVLWVRIIWHYVKNNRQEFHVN